MTATPKATTTKPVTKSPVTAQIKSPSPAEIQTQLNNAVDSLSKTLAELNAQKALNNVPASSEALNALVRSATINIICTTMGAGPLNPISASGVVIDPRGIILTNAHVGQYFLLKDYGSKNFISCIIRTGSPANPKYTAELMFLPPSWIEKNANKITESKPLGNGEYDYAFIRVTGVVGPSITIPSAFPFLPISPEPPNQGEEVLIAGYPAGFLGGITILKELYAASSIAKVGDVFTFRTNTLDLFSIGGSVVAQQGSSGGAVADGRGILVGLISTTSEGDSTGSRDLRAITTSYIARDFALEHGESLAEYFAKDPAEEAQKFLLGTAPTLTQQLVNALTGKK
jgi:S1-C subfamily serine protease